MDICFSCFCFFVLPSVNPTNHEALDSGQGYLISLLRNIPNCITEANGSSGCVAQEIMHLAWLV